MRIGFIGGVERSAPHYERVAETAGHTVSFHDGNLRHGGCDALAAFLDASDIVVIVTDVNSHAAVQCARKHMRSRGRSPLLVRRFGLTRFSAMLEALDVRDAAASDE